MDTHTRAGTFTGPDSGATPGKCTDTAGYISNWEIQQILDTPGNNAMQYYSEVAGDIMVYDSTQWISYMTTETYNSRLEWVQGLSMGGTSDWAMDLETSYYGNGTEVGTGSGVVYIDPSVLTNPDATIACIPPCTFVLPPWILSTSTVITQPPITSTILEMWTTVETIQGITTTVFVSITTVTTITLPPVTTDTISVWNVEWSDVSETIIYFTSSVVFPSIILTEASDAITSGTSSTVIPGVVYTYSPGPYPTSNPTSTSGPPPGPPPPGNVGSVHVSHGSPSPTCIPGSIGCGFPCLINCHGELPCFGICGCIGFGCPGGGGCLGAGCNGDDDNAGGGDGDDDDNSSSCSTTHTVTDCQVECSVTNAGTTTSSTCYSTTCVTVEACSPTGSTSTSQTTVFDCAWTTALTASMWVPTDADGPPPGPRRRWRGRLHVRHGQQRSYATGNNTSCLPRL